MAMTDLQQQQGNKAERSQNARRYGVIGVLAGAAIGLISGGGIAAMLKMALLGGGASAVGGAVAGDKLNPLFEKAKSLLPGHKETQENGQANAPEQLLAATFQRAPTPAQGQDQGIAAAQARLAQVQQRTSVSDLDEGQRNDLRAMAGASMNSARQGMAADAQALTPAGAARPRQAETHPAGISNCIH